jgi:hypothetical protein
MPLNSKFVAARLAALPPQDVSPVHQGGTINFLKDTAAVTAAFPANDYIEFGAIPSNAVINWHMSRFYNDAAGLASSKWNIGTDDAGSETCLAANIDATVVSGATGTPAVNAAISKIGQPLWQIAGLTKDPRRLMKIRVKLTGANGNAAANNIALELAYT